MMSNELLTLADIKPNHGSSRKRLRVGRGRASGAGKTANRGHNGEGQRSGNSSKRGFEGGQMPLYRRIPKFRTFPQPNVRQWLEINVKRLASFASEGSTTITYASLMERGHWFIGCDGVRLIGNATLNAAYTVQCHYATPGAKSCIEAAKGSVNVVEGPVSKLIS
jgi:large subunit ribosomal protein L15